MRIFGHQRPVRDPAGEIISLKESPVRAITHGELGHQFGSDWKRRLIVTLAKGDIVIFKPHGTRRETAGSANDIYRFLLRCEAGKLNLERARDRKAKKQQRLADARQRRAERKLTQRSGCKSEQIG